MFPIVFPRLYQSSNCGEKMRKEGVITMRNYRGGNNGIQFEEFYMRCSYRDYYYWNPLFRRADIGLRTIAKNEQIFLLQKTSKVLVRQEEKIQ